MYICIYVYMYICIANLHQYKGNADPVSCSYSCLPVQLILEWSLSLNGPFSSVAPQLASPTHRCKWMTAGERGMSTWCNSEWTWCEHEPHIHTDQKSKFLNAGWVWWFMFLCIPLNPSKSLTLGSTLTQAFPFIKQTVFPRLQTLTKQTRVHCLGQGVSQHRLGANPTHGHIFLQSLSN